MKNKNVKKRLIQSTFFIITLPFLSACGGGGESSSRTETANQNSPQTFSLLSATDTSNISNTANTTNSSDSANIADNSDNSSISPPLSFKLMIANTAPVPIANKSGSALTFSTNGFIDRSNPFFKAMGNGRACASCHQESQGWSITPQDLQARFSQTNGTDPIFKLVDGANSPNALDTTLDQRRLAYTMLLNKGLIRVGLPIPNSAEFTLIQVSDPYGFASAKELSLFRRPLPTTNLKFNSTVMWDARETLTDAKSSTCIFRAKPATCFATLNVDLLHQANNAVRGHAEATQDLSIADQQAIVDFENSLFTAQITSNAAGSLLLDGAGGGPVALSNNNFYFGINDIEAGDYKTGVVFNRNVMSMYGSWLNTTVPARNSVALSAPSGAQLARQRPPPSIPVAPSSANNAKAMIARGEALFNTRPFNISNVSGFNDELRVSLQRGTCTSCHNAPNVGTHSVARLFNTGVSNAARRTPDMPLYTLKNIATGEVIETTDPGNAMVTGKWKDIGRFKVPNLRGMGLRAPYFHDGSAKDLGEVVRFYDRRFRMGLTPQEVDDLTAFLQAL